MDHVKISDDKKPRYIFPEKVTIQFKDRETGYKYTLVMSPKELIVSNDLVERNNNKKPSDWGEYDRGESNVEVKGKLEDFTVRSQ